VSAPCVREGVRDARGEAWVSEAKTAAARKAAGHEVMTNLGAICAEWLLVSAHH
jgi:hypothetical protein